MWRMFCVAFSQPELRVSQMTTQQTWQHVHPMARRSEVLLVACNEPDITTGLRYLGHYLQKP